MNKIVKIISIFLALSLVTLGCSSKNNTNDKKAKGNYKIAVVAGEGGAKDKSFNQANVEGITAWMKENGGGKPAVIETNNHSDVAINLKNASKSSEIVSVAGYEFEEEIGAIADQHKDVKYLFIDNFIDKPNIASLIFKEQESSYLVGYLAALQSKTGIVGFLGGTKIPPVERFGIGFIQGAKAANKDIKVIYNYSGTFDDTNKCKTMAATMYDEGVDVIFVAAGNAGNGVITEAKERGVLDISKDGEIKHWVIGVDKDQYEEGLFKGKDKDNKEYSKSVILTSAVKNIEVAVTKILNEMKDGKFSVGENVFGIKENGVGIPKENPNVPKENINKLIQVIENIKSGKIDIVSSGEELLKKNEMNNIVGKL